MNKKPNLLGEEKQMF